MNSRLTFRIFSIVGAFLVGFWLPIRLVGYVPPLGLEIFFDLIISVVAAINIYFHFKEKPPESRWWSPGLLADLFCVLPFPLIAFTFFEETLNWVIIINLLSLRHLRQIKLVLDHFDNLQPIFYRLIPIVFTLPILIHVVACGWIALGGGTAGNDPDPIFNYVRAVYWTFTTLTTVGYGDISAKTMGQMLYACGVQIIGVGVFGYILSNVASLLSRSDAAREHHMDNLDKIETFMNTHEIPQSLRAKTRAYFHFLWSRKKGYLDHSLLEDLPNKLQSELVFYVNRSIVEKVPFLRGAQPDMIEDLMHELEPHIYVPGEKLFKFGEHGDALYFIHTGLVEILSKEGTQLATLSDGSFFGEMALVTDQPRNATARAVSFCDLYLLHREAFMRVLEDYPEVKDHVLETINLRRSAS